MRLARFYPAWFVLAACVCCRGAEPDAAREAEAAEALAANADTARGRDPYGSYLEIAAKYAETSTGELALRLALALDPETREDPRAGGDALRGILAGKASPGAQDAARLLLARLLLRSGDAAGAAELQRARGLAQTWSVAGPYGSGLRADCFAAFAPEGGEGETPAWRPAPETPGLPRIYPGRLFYKTGVTAYLSAGFTLPAGREVTLLAECDGVWKLYLDGAEIAVCTGFDREQPRELALRGNLPAGWHEVLVKLSGLRPETVFALRLLDPAGLPLPEISWDQQAPSGPAVPGKQGNFAIDEAAYLQQLRAAVKNNSSPWLRAALALACGEQGLSDEALAHARAAAAGPECLPRLFLEAETLAANSDLPRAVKEAELYGKYGNLWEKRFAPAGLRLAELELAGGDPLAAARMAREAARALPGSLAAGRLCVKIATALGRQHEARETAAGLRAAYPNSYAACVSLAQAREAEGDCPGALREWEQARLLEPALAEPALQAARLSGKLGGAARTEKLLLEAGAAARGEPARLAQALETAVAFRAEKPGATLAAELRGLQPDNPDCRRLEGDLLLLGGNARKAAAAYAESLELAPADFGLRELLHRFRGEPRFWEPYRANLIEALREATLRRYAGDTLSLLDQSVLLLYPDGTYNRYTRTARKLLTPRGVRQAGELGYSGTLVDAASVSPAGQWLKPLALPGRSALSMPGLTVGSAVDCEYVSGGRLDQTLPKWYFMSPDGHEDFIFSQYVIIAPAGFPLAVSERNFTPAVEFKRADADGMDVYVWTARNMPGAVHEPGAPDLEERLPYVWAGSRRSWSEVNRALLSPYLGAAKVTDAVAAAAKEICAGAASDAEKIRALHAYVLQRIRRSEKFSAAAQTLAAREGDRDALLVALLRAAGIKAEFAAARPARTQTSEPDWQFPAPEIYPLRLVAAENRGARVWLDTRYDCLLPDEMLEDTSGAAALVLTANGGRMENLPVADPAEFAGASRVAVRLDATGATARAELTRRGLAACRERENRHGKSEEENRAATEKTLAEILPGATAEKCSCAFGPGATFALQAEATAAGFAAAREDGGFDCPLPFFRLGLLPAGDLDPHRRRTPCQLRDYVTGEDAVTFENLRAERLPAGLMLRNRFGYYSLSFAAEGVNVVVRRSYGFAPQRIAVDEWESFVKMAVEIAEAESAALRLQPAPATKTE